MKTKIRKKTTGGIRFPVQMPLLQQLSRAMLQICYSGEACTELVVLFTRQQLHQIFSPTGTICKSYPLNLTVGSGTKGGERKYSLAHHEVPWKIDIRTEEQIKAARARAETRRKFEEARDRAARTAQVSGSESRP